MSKIITLSNGEATLSEIVTYGLKKKVSALLLKDRPMSAKDAKAGLADDFTVSYDVMENVRVAQVLGLLERLVINGEEKPISQETLESLVSDDFESIASAASAIVNPSDAAKKKKN